MKLDSYGDILTVDDVCTILLIGRNTAYKLLISQQIKNFQIGRARKIPKACLQEFILRNSLPRNEPAVIHTGKEVYDED